MSRPALVLVGIPGSGTSTVGALLADQLGLPLVDTDDLLEARIGAVGEFIAGHGEAALGPVEKAAALTALDSGGVVVLGGGPLAHAEVRSALAGLRVIWLRTSVATTTRRLGMHSLGMEALIAIRNRLETMLAERAPWFAAVATELVDTDRLRPEQVAATIVGASEEQP